MQAITTHFSCFSRLANWNGLNTSWGLLGVDTTRLPSIGLCSLTCLGTCDHGHTVACEYAWHGPILTMQWCTLANFPVKTSMANCNSSMHKCTSVFFIISKRQAGMGS